MLPTRKIAKRVYIEFEDGSTEDFTDVEARYSVSENCRVGQSQKWDEFFVAWILPIIEPVEPVEEEVHECVDMSEFLNNPMFAGIADGKVFFKNGTSKRIAS